MRAYPMKLKNVFLAVQTWLALSSVTSANTHAPKSSSVTDMTQQSDVLTTWEFCNHVLTDRSEGLLTYNEFFDPAHLKEYFQAHECFKNKDKLPKREYALSLMTDIKGDSPSEDVLYLKFENGQLFYRTALSNGEVKLTEKDCLKAKMPKLIQHLQADAIALETDLLSAIAPYQDDILKVTYKKGHTPIKNRFHDHIALRNSDSEEWLRDYETTSPNTLKFVLLGGSTGYERNGEKYLQEVMMLKSLVEEGLKRGVTFDVYNGGGSDAMEAAGLGPWLAGRSQEEVNDAISHLSTVPKYVPEDWIRTGIDVRNKYPRISSGTNMCVTVNVFGYRPPSPFCDYYATLSNDFTRAPVMERGKDILFFMPGGAGTRFEKAIADWLKSYDAISKNTTIIFYDSAFWKPFLEPLKNSNPIMIDTTEELITRVLGHFPLIEEKLINKPMYATHRAVMFKTAENHATDACSNNDKNNCVLKV